MSQPNGSASTVGPCLADRLREVGLESVVAIPRDACADGVQAGVQPARSGLARIRPSRERTEVLEAVPRSV